MPLSPTDNPQYNRLMGSLRHRRRTKNYLTGIVAWLIVIMLLFACLLIYMATSEGVIPLYCCCGSSFLLIFSVVLGINSTRYTVQDCARPENDLIVMSMISNEAIVQGYWHSIFGQLMTRQLVIFVALPFICGSLNLVSLLLLSTEDGFPIEGILAGLFLTVGQIGFYWFLVMLGIMLALALRHTALALGAFLVLSILSLSLWFIANLTVVAPTEESLPASEVVIFAVLLSIINLTPYVGLFIAWRVAIITARYSLGRVWQDYWAWRRSSA